MAEVPATVETVTGPNGDCVVVTWAGLANGDTGAPVEYGGYADRSAQVTGTFGTGGTAKIEGSNDGTNFAQLHDPGQTAIGFQAAGLLAVAEATRSIRPNISAGDGDTDLTVTLFIRRHR